MKKFWLLTAVVLVLALTLANAALAGPSFKAKPFEFVGTAAECGVAGIDTVTAAWITHQGLPDAGKSDHALLLEKLGETPNCAAAGAIIDGVGGITLTELGFDYRNGGHCGAGAPRYNVTTTAGFTYFFGCVSGVHTPAPDDPVNWTRVRFTNLDAVPQLATNPPWPGFSSATVQSIVLIFDEGSDTGPDFTGQIYLDNLDINGTLIGKPGNAK
jgi:hypothetical protein